MLHFYCWLRRETEDRISLRVESVGKSPAGLQHAIYKQCISHAARRRIFIVFSSRLRHRAGSQYFILFISRHVRSVLGN